MATIEILGWKDFVGETGWDNHVKSEFRVRLRRGINASPHEIRRLARRIEARETLSLCDVHDEAVHELTQMLQVMGANIRVDLSNANSPSLFRRTPRRGRP